MKKILFTCMVLLFTGSLSAQQTATTAVAPAAAPGAVLSELASGIDPKMYLKSFNRDAWKLNLDKIANPMAFGRSLTDLAFGLSPEAFGKDWATNKSAWMSKAKGITSYADASTMVKELESNLDPKALTPDWSSKKATWLKSLEGLK
jgi:hypothetical protein